MGKSTPNLTPLSGSSLWLVSCWAPDFGSWVGASSARSATASRVSLRPAVTAWSSAPPSRSCSPPVSVCPFDYPVSYRRDSRCGADELRHGRCQLASARIHPHRLDPDPAYGWLDGGYPASHVAEHPELLEH